MAYIPLPTFEEMDPETQEKARPIMEKTGGLGEIFRLLAVRKDIFFATDTMGQAYLLEETELPYRIKEAIALLVSQENSCAMCVDLHKSIARMLGLSEELVAQILQGVDAMEIPEREKELLRFCIRASRKENYKTTKEEIDALKELGYTESQIDEAVAIVGYFNYINTLSNVFGLGTEA